MVKLIKPCFDMQKRPVGREEQDLAMRHDQPLAVQSRGDAVASNSSRDTKTSKGIEPKALPEELYGPAVNPPGRRPQKRSASQERTHAQTAQLSRSRKPVGTAEQDPVAEKTKAVSTIESAQHWQALDKKKVYGGEQDQPRPPQPEVTSAQPVENPMTAAQDQRTKEVRKGYIQSILSILGLQWEAVAQDNRDNLAKLHCDHEEKIEKLEREIANQEQESRQASRRHKESEEKAEKELLKIKVEREQEKKQIQSLEASVRSFQVSRLQSLEGTQFMPIAASEICDRLEYIQDRVRQASKDFSKVSFDTFYQSCNWEAATAFPNCVPDMSKLANALKISKTMQKPGRASSLVLGCAFFNEIMTEVIGNPFFALAGEERLNKDLTIALGCVVDYAGQGDKAAAEALRCQILRLLDPPMDDESLAVSSRKASAAQSRHAASGRLAHTFLDPMLQTFFEDRQAAKALLVYEKIICEAAELSALIWTRKPRVRCSYPGPFYFSASMDVTAHPLHRAELDDDPEALDGKRIILVYSPAIWMDGTDDGQNFHQTKLIKKAVAWMG